MLKEESNILSELEVTGDFLTLTMHRAENVDDPERLKNIVEALLAFKKHYSYFPVHPRTFKDSEKIWIVQ